MDKGTLIALNALRFLSRETDITIAMVVVGPDYRALSELNCINLGKVEWNAQMIADECYVDNLGVPLGRLVRWEGRFK